MAGNLPPGGSIAMTTAVLDRTWHRPPVEPPEQMPRRQHLGWVAVAAFVLIAGLIAGGIALLAHPKSKGASGASSTSTTRPTSASTSTTVTTTSSSSPRQSGSASLVSAVLPMVVCPTSTPNTPSSVPVLPATISESVPSDLASQLAVYTDQQGEMKLLGPTGWSCAANFGEDGSGGVQVYPAGQDDPAGEQNPAPSDEAIIGTQNGGCVGCAVSQASRLFPGATTACDSEILG